MSRNFLRLFILIFMLAPDGATAQDVAPEISIEKIWDVQAGTTIYGGVKFDRGMVYTGGEDGVLHAIDAITGNVAWTYDAGAAIASSVAVDFYRLYFHTRDGVVHALNKDNGSEVWTFETEGERQWDDWDYYLSTPVVDGLQIYFGSGDHHVYALDQRTGHLRWKVKTQNIIHGEPVISGEKIIIGGFEGRLYAFDRGDGRELWRFKTVGTDYFRNGAIPGTASVKDGIVYFGGRDYNIYALLEETGTGAWNDKTPSWIVGKPLAVDDELIVVNSDGSRVFSYHNRTGQLNWEITNSYNMFAAAEVIGTSHVAIAGLDGRISILSRADGSVAGFFETDGARATRADYFTDEGALDYTGIESLDDLLDLYDRQMAGMGGIPGSVAVDGDIIYYATANGEIAAIRVGGIELPPNEESGEEEGE